MTDDIKTRWNAFFDNKLITEYIFQTYGSLYRKYLKGHIFLHGHDNYQKMRQMYDIMMVRKENNSNKDLKLKKIRE